MNDGLIPQRYAKALYKFVTEDGDAKNMYDAMKNVITSFTANPDLCKAMRNPFVSSDDKKKLLMAAAGDKADDAFKRFVAMIINHRREEYALLMAYAYRDIYRRTHNISQVEIITATKMDQAELDRILDIVKKSYPEETFEVKYDIDPDIIGGFIVNVDSVSLNASISNEIEQLRQKLLSH